MSVPLFLKYRTSGGAYFFCSLSGHIVRVSEDVYVRADNFLSCSDEELLTVKQLADNADGVDNTSQILKKMRAEGLFPEVLDNTNQLVKKIEISGRFLSFAGFIENYCQILLLELTEQCNLRCDYCVYGGNYPMARQHSSHRMSFETARKAVDQFIQRSYESCSIAFYGGEPLLEFGNLTRVVEYAEKLARQKEINLHFSITTNGTLLDENKLKFLVDKGFYIFISLDGGKTDHNRHRTFANKKQTNNSGTFDTIIKNVNRFIELYPDYSRRSFSVTLADSNDVCETDDFFRQYILYFSIQVSKVRSVSDKSDRISHTKSYQEKEQFRLEKFNIAWNEFTRQFVSSPFQSKKEHPLFYAILCRKVEKIHLRKIRSGNYQTAVCYHCIPGTARLFCNTLGEYYPCERVWNRPFFKIGSITNSIDVEQCLHLADVARQTVNCRNCHIQTICSICPSCYADSSGEIDAMSLRQSCLDEKNNCMENLILYTSIMEKNPRAFDDLDSADTAESSWFKSFKLLCS